LVPVAIEGAQIPATAATETYADGLSTSPLCLADDGTMALLADTAGATPGEALVGGALGAPQVVLRTGEAIELSASTEIITGIDLAGDRSGGGGLGGGKLAARIEYGAGETAIVLLHDVTDLDGDGTIDLLEAAFGTDAGIAADGQAGLPQLAADGSGNPVLEFRRQISGTSQYSYEVEASADLINWFPAQATLALSPDQGALPSGYERVIATPPTVPKKQFYRIRVGLL
jgi:hypothetical protein